MKIDLNKKKEKIPEEIIEFAERTDFNRLPVGGSKHDRASKIGLALMYVYSDYDIDNINIEYWLDKHVKIEETYGNSQLRVDAMAFFKNTGKQYLEVGSTSFPHGGVKKRIENIIIKELWNGNISPFDIKYQYVECFHIPKDLEYYQLYKPEEINMEIKRDNNTPKFNSFERKKEYKKHPDPYGDDYLT